MHRMQCERSTRGVAGAEYRYPARPTPRAHNAAANRTSVANGRGQLVDTLDLTVLYDCSVVRPLSAPGLDSLCKRRAL
ncbi:hypothetical protein EVAR_84888_1 [Eumeta japonica]|uniref:Uncharacterized protein n=1 Tax=Eumeta variegata TaxID=151549 RepID=A0A4C1YHR3_EUMVA|nr:hypothetical protein EVAR_84888_1 [Eumeta japonica]